jgi:hypothetical protein
MGFNSGFKGLNNKLHMMYISSDNDRHLCYYDHHYTSSSSPSSFSSSSFSFSSSYSSFSSSY